MVDRIRYVLSEGWWAEPNTDGLGLVINRETGDELGATLFVADPAALREALGVEIVPSSGVPKRDYTLDGELGGRLKAAGIIVGHIVIGPSHGPCHGAKEVRVSVGPGKGDILYPAAAALSPTGRIVPDRGSVSKGAQGRWAKFPPEAGLELDDIYDPKTPPPEDDCEVHKPYPALRPGVDVSALNRAYSGPSWGRSMTQRLVIAGRRAISEAADGLAENEDRLARGLFRAGEAMFYSTKYYG